MLKDFNLLEKKIDEVSVVDDSIFDDPNFSPYDKVHSVAHLNPEPGSISCNNLVLEVRYQIFWSGVEIAKVQSLNLTFLSLEFSFQTIFFNVRSVLICCLEIFLWLK